MMPSNKPLLNTFSFIIITVLSLAFYNDKIYSQNTQTKIDLTDRDGRPAVGVTVYVIDGLACYIGKTDQSGSVYLDIQNDEILVLASDLSNRKKYGIASFAPQYSSNSYTFRMPSFPRNNRSAGLQMDYLLDVVATYHDFSSLKDLYPDGIESFNSVLQSSLGIPGVFSVSPVPAKGKDGSLKMRVSGILVEPIMRLSALLPGNEFVYTSI